MKERNPGIYALQQWNGWYMPATVPGWYMPATVPGW